MDRIDEFMEACKHGHLDRMRSFLKSSEPVDVNCTDDDGNTALQAVAVGGQDAALALLLLSGALVDKTNRCGWTPLMQAARQGNTAAVDVLLGYGANVDVVGKLGTTALLCAVRSGVLSCVKVIVENGACRSPLASELTPLMVASQLGLNSIVKYLVDVGFDVDQTTKSAGLNALMFAASNGHEGTVQLLVECGANAKSTNACGKNALDFAISRGKKRVRCFLGEDARNGNSDLYEQAEADVFEAIADGDLPSVRRFLEDRPYLANGVRKPDGATPLTFAATLGDLGMMEFLLAAGAIVDVQDANGWTPLMQAVYHGHKEAALFVLRNGADTSLRDRNGYCAFEIGALAPGADVDLLRNLAPLYAHVSQTLSTSGFSVSDSGTKQNWWNQLGGYFQQLKARMPKVLGANAQEAIGLSPSLPSMDCERPRPEANCERSSRASNESGSTSNSNRTLDPSESVDERLFRLNAASPCRLARAGRSLEPIVLPLLSPYRSDAGHFGRPTITATVTLPERFTPAIRYEPSSTESSHDGDVVDCDQAASSPIVADSTANLTMKDDLREILQSFSLEKYHSLFCEEEVDTMAFALLTERDLKELGIDDADSRRRLVALGSKLRNNSKQPL